MEIHEFIHSVERLRGDLLRQARRLLDSEDDAEDAVQETLIKLWIMKERILNADKMRNMATVVCRNVSLNILRDARQSVPIETAEVITLQGNPQVLLEQQESRQKLKRSIEKLTDKQRAILRMRNVENMTYADIAKIIGSSESSVRGMISKARLALLKQMKGTKE
ncbi:MAG: sigma-70 family RNA polymerase sigma factor [Bacteroidales bacterium]|nr:sigma-70 family RNA polymerase sigma factor [Bacteroidales bacterium]